MLPYELTGNKDSKNLVIFLHGFPDSFRLWDCKYQQQLETIAGLDKSNAQFLNVSYPNYHRPLVSKWGLSQPEIVANLKTTIDFIDGGRKLKKLLVTHDWGAYFGYLFDHTYPNYVQEIVALDIGGHIDPKGKAILMLVSYQWTFLVSFLLTMIPIVGEFIGTLISSLYMRFFFGIRPPRDYTAKLNYPYYYVWKNKLQSLFDRNKLWMARYTPSVPVCFLYGINKPFMFHSPKWLLTLSKNKQSEVQAVKAGHWIQKEQPQIVIDKILERLNRL